MREMMSVVIDSNCHRRLVGTADLTPYYRRCFSKMTELAMLYSQKCVM